MLPDQRGVELADDLAARKPQLAVLLSTGYSDEESHAAAIRQRGYEFLQKPVLAPELLHVIRDLIDAQ